MTPTELFFLKTIVIDRGTLVHEWLRDRIEEILIIKGVEVCEDHPNSLKVKYYKEKLMQTMAITEEDLNRVNVRLNRLAIQGRELGNVRRSYPELIIQQEGQDVDDEPKVVFDGINPLEYMIRNARIGVVTAVKIEEMGKFAAWAIKAVL
ncbi:hypothetical protein POM88_021341 [Heracleum sosnowskyi]|uniref:Uncharacterized protein n=1 Tax=Heracleum sosnowskyi TaxID=360622 RepID=A0AAD8IEN5_9APIA|nr:hypothetical protein POM88_021341 [Heracleum sosnowskyi]